jgi:hypothetical protein
MYLLSMARQRIGALRVKQGKTGHCFSEMIAILDDDIPMGVFPTTKDGEAATTRPD